MTIHIETKILTFKRRKVSTTSVLWQENTFQSTKMVVLQPTPQSQTQNSTKVWQMLMNGMDGPMDFFKGTLLSKRLMKQIILWFIELSEQMMGIEKVIHMLKVGNWASAVPGSVWVSFYAIISIATSLFVPKRLPYASLLSSVNLAHVAHVLYVNHVPFNHGYGHGQEVYTTTMVEFMRILDLHILPSVNFQDDLK